MASEIRKQNLINKDKNILKYKERFSWIISYLRWAIKLLILWSFCSVFLITLWFYIYSAYLPSWDWSNCMLIYVANDFQWCTYKWIGKQNENKILFMPIQYHIDKCWFDDKQNYSIEMLNNLWDSFKLESKSKVKNGCFFYNVDTWKYDFITSLQCWFTKFYYQILPKPSPDRLKWVNLTIKAFDGNLQIDENDKENRDWLEN